MNLKEYRGAAHQEEEDEPDELGKSLRGQKTYL
jgi:hypothetical protein